MIEKIKERLENLGYTVIINSSTGMNGISIRRLNVETNTPGQFVSFKEQELINQFKDDVEKAVHHISASYNNYKLPLPLKTLVSIDNVCYRACNKQLNPDWVDFPFTKEILDLVLIPEIRVSQDDGDVVCKLNKSLLEAYKDELSELTEERIIENTKNRGTTIKTITDAISEMGFSLGENKLGTDENTFYVLSTANQLMGVAPVLLSNTLEDLSANTQSDLIIIPSSVHELLAIPNNVFMSVKDVKEMVTEVNNSCVAEDEILSYNVYYYYWDKKILEVKNE